MKRVRQDMALVIFGGSTLPENPGSNYSEPSADAPRTPGRMVPSSDLFRRLPMIVETRPTFTAVDLASVSIAPTAFTGARTATSSRTAWRRRHAWCGPVTKT